MISEQPERAGIGNGRDWNAASGRETGDVRGESAVCGERTFGYRVNRREVRGGFEAFQCQSCSSIGLVFVVFSFNSVQFFEFWGDFRSFVCRRVFWGVWGMCFVVFSVRASR